MIWRRRRKKRNTKKEVYFYWQIWQPGVSATVSTSWNCVDNHPLFLPFLFKLSRFLHHTIRSYIFTSQAGAPYVTHWQQKNPAPHIAPIKSRRGKEDVCLRTGHLARTDATQALARPGRGPCGRVRALTHAAQGHEMLPGVNEGLNPPWAHQHCF